MLDRKSFLKGGALTLGALLNIPPGAGKLIDLSPLQARGRDNTKDNGGGADIIYTRLNFVNVAAYNRALLDIESFEIGRVYADISEAVFRPGRELTHFIRLYRQALDRKFLPAPGALKKSPLPLDTFLDLLQHGEGILLTLTKLQFMLRDWALDNLNRLRPEKSGADTDIMNTILAQRRAIIEAMHILIGAEPLPDTPLIYKTWRDSPTDKRLSLSSENGSPENVRYPALNGVFDSSYYKRDLAETKITGATMNELPGIVASVVANINHVRARRRALFTGYRLRKTFQEQARLSKIKDRSRVSKNLFHNSLLTLLHREILLKRMSLAFRASSSGIYTTRDRQKYQMEVSALIIELDDGDDTVSQKLALKREDQSILTASTQLSAHYGGQNIRQALEQIRADRDRILKKYAL